MKKIAVSILVLLLGGVLSACQGQASGQDTEKNETAVQESTQTEDLETKDLESENSAQENHVLIAYFTLGKNAQYPGNVDATTSASLVDDGTELYGTTEYVGRMIQSAVGGDMHLIETAEPYPTDFDAVVDQNHEEMGAGTLPKLKSSDIDLSQYDTVFIGYPIWATNAPQAIFSFLEEYDLSGKTVIPFCTHDGYGAGNSYSDIADAVPGAEVFSGLAIEAGDVPGAEDTVTQWLDEIGISGSAENVSENQSETPIQITIGDEILEGVIYDTALAQEISGQFPLTVSMGNFGGREYYGAIDFTPEQAGEGQLFFESGDITYCSRNNTLAIFYAQTDNPDLTMEIIPIGKVTSDLAAFDELPGNVEITFELVQ